MADRLEKLAAARKKLKEYQDRGRSISPAKRNKPKLGNQVSSSHSGDLSQENSKDLVPQNNIPSLEATYMENSNTVPVEAEKETMEAIGRDLTVILPDSERVTVHGNDQDYSAVPSKQSSGAQPSLEQQLASQLETISFLVAERNDLQRSLQICQQTCETLKRDKASFESKFAEVQKEASHLQYNLSILQSQTSTLQVELDSHKSKCHELSEENHQAKEQILALNSQVDGLRRSLQAKTLECGNLQDRVNVLEANRLHESNVEQVETLQAKKAELSQEIQDYKERLSRLTGERDTLNQQYQQYIVRLNNQSRALTTQLEQVTKERTEAGEKIAALQSQYQEAQQTIAKLEEQLKNNEDVTITPTETVNVLPLQAPDDDKSTQIEQQQRKYQELVTDNDQLSRLVLEKEALVQELYLKVERLEDELNSHSQSQLVEEKEKLLVALQSDKAAAARAVAQNRQLKLQVEELEKGFVVVSNSKLELAEKLESERHALKDLRVQFESQAQKLESMRQDLEQRSQATDSKQVELLQQELQEAQERIRALTQQNTEMKRLLFKRNTTTPDHDHDHEHQHCAHNHLSHHDDQCSHDQEHSENHHDHHEHSHCDHDHSPVRKDIDSNRGRIDSPESEFRESKVPMVDHLALRAALQQLESRFQRAMDQVATLSDDNQRLEHLVLQLQSETETIGEYVSLYQTQRGLLNQRAQELARDSAVLKSNVGQLARLLSVVLPDNSETSQALQDLQQLSLQEGHLAHLCEEHSSSLRNGTPTSATVDSVAAAKESQHSSPVVDLTADKAAHQIVQLLSDLTSFNFVRSESAARQLATAGVELEAPPMPETFHPCTVCSGRLLTV